MAFLTILLAPQATVTAISYHISI